LSISKSANGPRNAHARTSFVPHPGHEKDLRQFYRTLFRNLGPQHWWPAQSRFEVIAGAFLTQNTSWKNVQLALANLRRRRLLSLNGIRRTSQGELEALIRPAGYFRQKARSLKAFVEFLDERHHGSLVRMFRQPTRLLREELLALRGVGPETADSILLYGGGHPVFVVDAYARRILERHGILPPGAHYEEVRALMESALGSAGFAGEAAALHGLPFFQGRSQHRSSRVSRMPLGPQARVFNEMHGLVVAVGKDFCRKTQPRCDTCPLGPLLLR